VRTFYFMVRNRYLKTSKTPLESHAQCPSLFMSAATNQRGCPEHSSWEVQVRFPEETEQLLRRVSFSSRVVGHRACLCSCVNVYFLDSHGACISSFVNNTNNITNNNNKTISIVP